MGVGVQPFALSNRCLFEVSGFRKLAGLVGYLPRPSCASGMDKSGYNFFFCVPGHARSAKSAVYCSVSIGLQSCLWASATPGHVLRLRVSKVGQDCRMWLGV